jgi:hypothetical protein
MGFLSNIALAGALATAALVPASAQQTLEVSPWTVAEFGGPGGDALSIEKVSGRGAVILLNPRGEECTLRFPLKIGEKIRVRGATVEEQQAVCEVLLISTTEAASAVFSFECLNQTPTSVRACPASK